MTSKWALPFTFCFFSSQLWRLLRRSEGAFFFSFFSCSVFWVETLYNMFKSTFHLHFWVMPLLWALIPYDASIVATNVEREREWDARWKCGGGWHVASWRAWKIISQWKLLTSSARRDQNFSPTVSINRFDIAFEFFLDAANRKCHQRQYRDQLVALSSLVFLILLFRASII